MTAFGGALTDPTKVMGSRIGAYIVDAVLISILLVGTLFVLDAGKAHTIPATSPAEAARTCSGFNSQHGSTETAPDGTVRSGDYFCWVSGSNTRLINRDDLRTIQVHSWLVGAALSFLDLVALQVLVGASIGKLLFGLRVVTLNGRRAGWGRNLVRWPLLVVDAACCWLPGLISSFNSKGHKRIGDMAAGTFVVHRSAEGRLLGIPGLIPDHVLAQLALAQAAAASMPVPAPSNRPTTADEPVFDPSRNTYVRYDPAGGAWFQWDDVTQEWVPIQT